MIALVTGGTGFVGRNLVQRLHEEASELRVLTRNRDSRHELAVLPRVRLINCDVHDAQALRRTRDRAFLVHR